MANAPTNDVALLLRAAKDDDVRGLSTLYEDLQGDIDLSNAIGQNALHVAAIWGSLGAIEFLLEHGFVDRIVHRKDLQKELSDLIGMLTD